MRRAVIAVAGVLCVISLGCGAEEPKPPSGASNSSLIVIRHGHGNPQPAAKLTGRLIEHDGCIILNGHATAFAAPARLVGEGVVIADETVIAFGSEQVFGGGWLSLNSVEEMLVNGARVVPELHRCVAGSDEPDQMAVIYNAQ